MSHTNPPVVFKWSRIGYQPILLATNQVTVSLLGDQGMACQATPGWQIDRHTGVGRPNLERLTGGEAAHEVSNFIQWTSSTSFITSVIEGIGTEDRNVGTRSIGGDLTQKRSPGCLPFLHIECLASTGIDPQCAKSTSAARLGCPTKDICTPGDFKTDKTSCHDRGL